MWVSRMETADRWRRSGGSKHAAWLLISTLALIISAGTLHSAGNCGAENDGARRDSSQPMAQDKSTQHKSTQHKPEEESASSGGDSSDKIRPSIGATVLNEDERPAWVGREPWTEAGLFRIWVEGEPGATPEEAKKLLERALVARVHRYARNHPVSSGSIDFITTQYVREELMAEEAFYDEIMSPTFGKLYRGHGLLGLSPEFIAKLDDVKREAEQRERVEATAVLGGGVLLVMALGALFLSRKSHMSPGMLWQPARGVVVERSDHLVGTDERSRSSGAGVLGIAAALMVAGVVAVVCFSFFWFAAARASRQRVIIEQHRAAVPEVHTHAEQQTDEKKGAQSSTRRRLIGEIRKSQAESTEVEGRQP